jgi:hypothetical protein
MKYILWILLGTSTYSHGDTIDHYMNIANGIPQMEMKADEQSQAWARSARTVLTLTCDGITDSLMLANETATQLGKPLFCLTPGAQINPEMLSALIQQTYQSLSTAQADKDKMTVSQVALLGIQKQYPCKDDSAQKKAPEQAPTWEVAR